MGTNTLRLQRKIMCSVSDQKPKSLRLSHSGRRWRRSFAGTLSTFTKRLSSKRPSSSLEVVNPWSSRSGLSLVCSIKIRGEQWLELS